MIVLNGLLLFISSCEYRVEEEESDWVEVTINAQVIVHEYGALATAHTVIWNVWIEPPGDEMDTSFVQMTNDFGETSMSLIRKLFTGQTLYVKVSSFAYPEGTSGRQLQLADIRFYAGTHTKSYEWYPELKIYIVDWSDIF